MQAQLHMQTLCSGHLPVEGTMSRTPNGTPASELPVVRWQKSSRSNSQGNCVELARLDHGQVAVRNSRDPQGPALIYTRAEMVAFIEGAKDGDFAHLIG